MEIRLELNQRFGDGFQIRLLHGPMNKLYDNEPLTLYEAQAYAGALLDEVNRTLGTDYKQNQVVRVPKGALDGNAKTDFAAARVLQDIQNQKYTLSVPAGPDVLECVVNGEKQPVVSGRGVILLAWIAWKEDGMPQARDAMRRYCEYISAPNTKAHSYLSCAQFGHNECGHGQIRQRCRILVGLSGLS